MSEAVAMSSKPAASSAPITRMQALRGATRLVHARVEAALPLLDPDLTRARYARVVETFHGFYAPLEPSIARAAAGEAEALTLQLRAKLPLLATDLLALGRTPAEVARLPRCRRLPLVDSTSRALGALYVLEGATLGGQIIIRKLRDGLGIDAASGAAFFSGYGAATSAMWTRFVDHVNQSSTIDTNEAVHAAVETFETLTLWLEASLGHS